MPYIEPEDRPQLDKVSESIAMYMLSDGDLNYLITRIVDRWISHDGKHRPNYALFNAAIGVLECVKQELYRRVIADYEDQKRLENGDVYKTVV